MQQRGNFFKEQWLQDINRGWHNLSFDNTFTCNAGDMVPTKCIEVFPGDFVHDQSSAMARLMPLVAPVMGKMNLFSYHFIVRNRDIWTQWDKFITNYDQKRTWQQNVNFVPPVMPYIKVDEILFGPIYISSVGSPETIGDFQNVLYLLQYEANNRGCSVITDSKEGMLDFINNASFADKRVYVIIPNRDDDFGDEISTTYYNPFSPGALLEFLGINIDGFYRKVNRNLYLLVGNASGVMQNAYTLPWTYTDDIDSSPFDTETLGGSYVPFTPSREWMDAHCVLGYCQTADKTETHYTYHWLANGVQTTSGSQLEADWYQAPFKSENAALFDYELTDLSLRAYRFIYDEYFRDENYIEVNSNTDFSRDGNDLDWQSHSWRVIWEYLTLCKKAFEHDLYTSALPSAQRGNPVRFLPDSKVKFVNNGSLSQNVAYDNSGNRVGGADLTTTSPNAFVVGNNNAVHLDNSGDLLVDLSAATIENFRFYNSMQRYLELKARTGGRYYEYMIGQWGFAIEDAKLNRPIYLDGNKVPVQISEVTQTSASDVETGQPLGDLAGRGVAIGEDHRIEFTVPDVGFLIEICVVAPRTSYGQGISPKFKRFNYMDYPLPSFANLGEEPVKTRELYATLHKSDDDAAFGYQSRYYQFKYERDQVHGSMLTDLRHWTFARLFNGVPYNGKDFLEVKPSYRQFAVTSERFDHFLVTMWHDIQVNRALPEHSIPSL